MQFCSSELSDVPHTANATHRLLTRLETETYAGLLLVETPTEEQVVLVQRRHDCQLFGLTPNEFARCIVLFSQMLQCTTDRMNTGKEARLDVVQRYSFVEEGHKCPSGIQGDDFGDVCVLAETSWNLIDIWSHCRRDFLSDTRRRVNADRTTSDAAHRGVLDDDVHACSWLSRTHMTCSRFCGRIGHSDSEGLVPCRYRRSDSVLMLCCTCRTVLLKSTSR